MDKNLLRKDCVMVDRPHPKDDNGHQIVYAFENGYGASVIRYKWNYRNDMFASMGQMIGGIFGMNLHFGESIGYDKGLWEIAFLKIVDENTWELLNTSLFNNAQVKGNLTEEEINEILLKIENSDFEIVDESMYEIFEDETMYED